MKKKICVFAIVISLIVLISTGIYAYYTYRKSIENAITLAYNEIQIDEIYNPPKKMEKGISYRRQPSVKNLGNIDCYVRIKSLISDSRILDDIDIDYNKDDYIYNELDGYYYYNKVLKPGKSSDPLFTKISIHSDASDLIFDGFELFIYAESVQTINNKEMMEVWHYFS